MSRSVGKEFPCSFLVGRVMMYHERCILFLFYVYSKHTPRLEQNPDFHYSATASAHSFNRFGPSMAMLLLANTGGMKG